MGVYRRNYLVSGRFVANVVIGILKDDQPGDIFLLACEVLEKSE